MTGFGKSILDGQFGRQQWEIKSVNCKYLEFKWKLPGYLRNLEYDFERIAQAQTNRGRIEIALTLKLNSNFLPDPVFDYPLAISMINSISALASQRGESLSFNYSDFLNVPNLWGDVKFEIQDAMIVELEKGFNEALIDWNKSRTIEGELLSQDLLCRIKKMNEWVIDIESCLPQIKEQKLKSLKDRLLMVLDGIQLDEQRFLQEVVILADKIDTSEELTRLKIHLERLGKLLSTSGGIGRKLDFTLQECFREINTCGNKLLDSHVSQIIVDFKNELEKCREQAMNLE